jgi:putative DNA primase/helicase
MRADGEIHSLQFIGPDGDKHFLFGGRVKGCYFSIGNPNGAAALCNCRRLRNRRNDPRNDGIPRSVAFNAGNVGTVAKAMRDKFPDLPMILCADDDYRTEGNPGLTKATEAARAVGGLLAIPDFGSNRPDGA